MKSKAKYAVMFLPLILLVTAALLAPRVSSGWYDRQTLGQLSHENMDYEPYEISPYHSFADKMEAIAAGVSGGTSLYKVKLKERRDAPENQELVEIINAELKVLYEKSILPQEWSIQELEERTFYQMYVIPEDNEEVLFQDVCYWYITAETEEGSVMLTMDSTFYKIYAVRMYYEEEQIPVVTSEWLEKQLMDDFFSLTEEWCSYWELEAAELVSAYKDQSYGNVATDGLYGAGEGYIILFPGGYQLYEWNCLDYYKYGISGAAWGSGIQALSP